jgi:sec-independent protein translocase protein TatA
MLAIPMLGPTELLLTLFIALLVFGNRLPSVMRSLGSSVNEFKKGLNDASEAPVAAPVAPVQAPLAAPQQVVTKQLP